jgi:four helix bundle protein
MSNMSEGFESQTQAQFIRYLGIAKASAGEVRSQLYVSRDLEYITQEQFARAFAMAEKNISPNRALCSLPRDSSPISKTSRRLGRIRSLDL